MRVCSKSVLHDDELGRLFGAVRYGEKRVHAQTLDFTLTQDAGGHASLLAGDFLCGSGKVGWCAHIRWQIAKISRQRHSFHDCLGVLSAEPGLGGVAALPDRQADSFQG